MHARIDERANWRIVIDRFACGCTSSLSACGTVIRMGTVHVLIRVGGEYSVGSSGWVCAIRVQRSWALRHTSVATCCFPPTSSGGVVMVSRSSVTDQKRRSDFPTQLGMRLTSSR